MRQSHPSRVLIAGGKPGGGIASFAEALHSGFVDLGIPAEVVPDGAIFARPRELRDPQILKILSIRAVFAAPFARRAFCVAHGFPCAANQGWPATIAILASLNLAAACTGTQLVVVSEYSALHLRSIFRLRIDAVIHNPLRPLFFEQPPQTSREAITFVGRLHRSKNVEKLIPAIRDVLDENPGLRALIAGEGEMRPLLNHLASADPRIVILGGLAAADVRDLLSRSRVFVSANPTEPFGIAYLEALSQGCVVAMPASGGGLEIAPELIGSTIQLFPSSVSRSGVASALRRALQQEPRPSRMDCYSPRAVAEAYLAVDQRFAPDGVFHAETTIGAAAIGTASMERLHHASGLDNYPGL